jgi:hypothetical protein
MTRRILGSTCVAAMLAVTVSAAQGSSQAPVQAPTAGNPQQRPAERANPTTPRTQSDQQVTLTGCVVRDGANDFVLASAMPSGASGNVSAGVPGSTSAGAVGTTGSSSGSSATTTGTAAMRYRLSGERDLDQYLGQRVEIVGRTDGSASAGATSPATAGVGTRSTSPGPTSATGSAAGTTSDSPRSTAPTTGATTPGTTSGPSTAPGGSASTPSGNTSGAAAAIRSAAGQAPMQHVTITSVRALGGNCQ